MASYWFEPEIVTLEVGGRTLTLETGRLAKQAAGAVVVTYGETSVLVTAARATNAKATIARPKRKPVDEVDQAGDRFVAAKVGDVDPLNGPRLPVEMKHLLQADETFFRIGVKRFEPFLCLFLGGAYRNMIIV